ncbi:hypothetical protein TNCV_1348131 [Trichonephila clavipes]|nr:hypothetical protein TNCV_1348131 [Trichonephila clavipes]
MAGTKRNKDSSIIPRLRKKLYTPSCWCFFLMPPVGRSQNEAHEIHRGKGLEVRQSLPRPPYRRQYDLARINSPKRR